MNSKTTVVYERKRGETQQKDIVAELTQTQRNEIAAARAWDEINRRSHITLHDRENERFVRAIEAMDN